MADSSTKKGLMVRLWVVATGIFTATPILLSKLAPSLPRPPAYAIGFLLASMALYPLARGSYARTQGRALTFWQFFPYPFAGAVIGMVVMGLLGG